MKVTTFGEIMLRLAPVGNLRFQQAQELRSTFGGGEANVAVSLANYGIEADFVSKLPDNEIGDWAISDLKSMGVNTKNIKRGGDRVGVYYLEKGASQRPSNVVYDRKYSSISQAKESDFNWDKILDNTNWFHFTGITPALGKGVLRILMDALKVAKRKGIKVSCDLNYRTKLWSRQEAKEVMTHIMPFVDVLIANEEDAENVFDIKAKGTSVLGGKLDKKGYLDVAKQLQEKFNLEYVAITLRESESADNNKWGAMLYHNNIAYYSKSYNLHIVDRVGGGDSFGAGLIYSLLNQFRPQESVEFATAASCLKHTIEGDYNRVTVEEVLSLMNGNETGRVNR